MPVQPQQMKLRSFCPYQPFPHPHCPWPVPKSDIGTLYPNFKPLHSIPISLPHFPLSVFLKIIHIIGEKVHFLTYVKPVLFTSSLKVLGH